MTNPMELTPPGRDVSQAEQDSWLRLSQQADAANVIMYGDDNKPRRLPNGFDPMAPISPLAHRLLLASNGLWDRPTDGPRWAEPGTSRHTGFKFDWSRK